MRRDAKRSGHDPHAPCSRLSNRRKSTMSTQPLAGLRVIEFSQMVMGPCCGLILADLGAEVIKVEPLPRGDRTRYLPGLGGRLLRGLQPQQEEHRGRHEKPARPCPGQAPGRRERRRRREFQARHDGGLRSRLRVAREAQRAADLLLAQRLSARPLRAPHSARRDGADDGRSRIHDRPARAGRCVPAHRSTTSWARCSA